MGAAENHGSFVSNLLKEAFAEGARDIAARIPSEQLRWRCRIREIRENEISIDAFEDSPAKRYIPKNVQADFSLFFHGGKFTFTTRFIEIRDDELFLEMPRTVEMEDRRPYCRVSPGETIPVEIIEIEGYPSASQVAVANISQSGLGLEFPGLPENFLDRDTIRLTIKIGDLMEAVLTGRIRYAKRTASGFHYVGLDLYDMTENQKAAFSACIHAGQSPTMTITSHPDQL